MTEDESDPHVPEVTRREAMSTPAKAAVGGVGVLGLLGISTGSASAQQSLEPAQVLRDSQDREIRLRMLGGDLLLEHVPSGATFSYDQSEGYWALNGTLDAGGNDVQNVGGLDADSITADETVTETLTYDRSSRNPAWPRQPEQSSTLSFRPHPSVSNPVLTASDVTDVTGISIGGVADPFIVYESGTYHMFFEARGDNYVISHATSETGFEWTYNQVVLDDKEHSYPYVFKWQGTWYMTPRVEGSGGQFDIYEATSFPTNWSLVETPISPSYNMNDPTPVFWNGRWYLFADDSTNDNSRLYVAGSDVESLTGRTWSEHSASPYYSGSYRQGGRPLVDEHYIDLPRRTGGEAVRMRRVTELTPNDLTTELMFGGDNILNGSHRSAWDGAGKHHVDALMPSRGQNNVVVVDGRSGTEYSIGAYTTSDVEPSIVHAYPSSDQSIPSGAWATLELDSRRHDLSDSWGISAHEFAVPTSGYYDFSAGAWFLLTGETGYMSIRVRNTTTGENIAFDRVVNNGGNGNVHPSDDAVDYASEGDTIVAEAYQDTGSSLTVSAFEPATYFSARRVW